MGSIIIPIFCVLGSLVVLSYLICIYLLSKYPEAYDSKGIWAGLLHGSKYLTYLWYLGEVLSCIGFLSLTAFLWDSNTFEENIRMEVFYTLFLCSELFWMPLAIQGDRFYLLTIVLLFFASIGTIGLFVESLLLWGISSYKGWLLLPLVLHCTFFDFVYWCITWMPSPYQLSSQHVSLMQTDQRVIFVVQEEESYD